MLASELLNWQSAMGSGRDPTDRYILSITNSAPLRIWPLVVRFQAGVDSEFLHVVSGETAWHPIEMAG